MADLNIGNSSANVVVNAKHNGSVTPQINNTYDLGTSALRWKYIYGNLNGNATSATNADTIDGLHASDLTKIYKYTVPAKSGVRIKYPSYSPCLVTACGGNNGAQLIILGIGYGVHGSIRNTWTELVSCSESHFTWSLPEVDEISCSVEVMNHRDSNSEITVWANDTIGFSAITALTSPKQNHVLLHSKNYTNYTVTKTGGGASGTWSININGSSASCTGNAATATNADKLDNKHANEFMYFNYDPGLGGGSPANIAKSYFVDNEKTPKGIIKGYYNDSGEEYSQLYSRSKAGNTGSILKWGYNDRYIRILRYAHDWKSEDWEKIDAGNADTATKLKNARTISLTGSVTGSGTFDGSGNLSIATTTNHTHAAATTSANGFMSSDDKAKLDGITASADAVSFSRSLTSGTKVGTITINGTGTDLYAPTNTDTKNTAGSSNTSSKIFLVGATSQVSNTTTYSHDTTYVNSDEALVSSAFTTGTNHIIAPKGGQYSTRTDTVTGYLKITLPVSWNNTMMRFYVDIYNYQINSMVTYMIGGYNYENSSWINTSAVAYGRKGSKLSNLKVHFGHDGSKCAIYIGSADTTWDYPQVMVRDILVGFGRSALDLDSGWSIGFTTTLGTITVTVDNPYIGYNAYTADNVAWSGITNKPSYYDAKAIKSITRSGTTFTATHLDGTTSTFTQQDNNTVYSHPAGSAVSKSSGLYKFSTDSTSHISGVTAVTKADITALGIPGQDTTYGSMSVDEGTTGTATTNRVLTAANLKGIINAHAPTKTGGGASGTWGISISGNAATASKVNNKLTVGSKSYDGSAAVTIEASDLGLASAMLFLGTTTTAITDGATTNPVAISGSNKTVTAGNVVLYGSKEFVWTGSAWEELGNEGSYKIVQAAVADPSASGTSNTFIDTISQDTNGKITVTKKTVAVTNSAPTLAWGTTSTIGTVAGTNLQVKMPANPNTDTKVTQTVTTSNAAYPLLLAPSGQTATTTTTSYFDSGVTLNPSTNTIAANVSGNAATATISRSLGSNDTMKIYAQSSNEVNFGGTSNLDTIYFGYRAVDSKPIPSKFIFGGDGTAELIAAKFTGTLNGNAATATNVAWSGITNKPSYYDIPKYISYLGHYASSDTHILQLGYWNCTDVYDNLTLLVASSFWGNQHGSTDIITLRQDLNDNASGAVHCSCNRVTLMNSNRTFYYNIDQTNRRVYLYVYVSGGNGYGKWNTSVLQSDGGSWVSEFAANQPNQSSFVTISEITAAAADTSNYLNINNSANCSYGLQYMQHYSQTSGNDLPSNTWWHVIKMNHGNGDTYYKRLLAFDFWNDNIMTSGASENGKTRAWKQVWVQGNSVTGAVWNDYAEYREADTIQGGRCVREVGDDTLTLTTKRLMRGCSITSDTWGFAQGETDKAKTPIAVAGRVLAYPLEDRDLFKEYIGYSVCSGPDGTVSLMTEEEELKYPWAIVGTVSAVPDYEEWGGGEIADRPSVKVDGRIWIKVK